MLNTSTSIFSNRPYYQVKKIFDREAPWSSGERRGLTVWAMVLGCEFNSRVHLKTRWIKWTTWWQKKNKNNKDSQKGQVTPKKYFKKKIFDQRNHWNVDIIIKSLSTNIPLCFIIFVLVLKLLDDPFFITTYNIWVADQKQSHSVLFQDQFFLHPSSKKCFIMF